MRHRGRVSLTLFAIGSAALLGAQIVMASAMGVEHEATQADSSGPGEVLAYQLSHHQPDHREGKGQGKGQGKGGYAAAEQGAPPPPPCQTPTEQSPPPADSTTPTSCQTAPEGGGSETPSNGGSETPSSGGSETPSSGGSQTPSSGGSQTPSSGGSETPSNGGSETPSEEPPPPPEGSDDNWTSDESQFAFRPGTGGPSATGPPAPLVPLAAGPVMIGAGVTPLPAVLATGGSRISTTLLSTSVLVARVSTAPGPSYEPSLALDSFLPAVAESDDWQTPMVADPAPRMTALGGQVNDERVSLWLVASVSFLILLAVCAASLTDVGGLLRDYLDRRYGA